MKIDEFHRARDLSEYVVTLEWVLHHLMQHEAEHRDKYSIYGYAQTALFLT